MIVAQYPAQAGEGVVLSSQARWCSPDDCRVRPKILAVCNGWFSPSSRRLRVRVSRDAGVCTNTSTRRCPCRSVRLNTGIPVRSQSRCRGPTSRWRIWFRAATKYCDLCVGKVGLDVLQSAERGSGLHRTKGRGGCRAVGGDLEPRGPATPDRWEWTGASRASGVRQPSPHRRRAGPPEGGDPRPAEPPSFRHTGQHPSHCGRTERPVGATTSTNAARTRHASGGCSTHTRIRLRKAGAT